MKLVFSKSSLSLAMAAAVVAVSSTTPTSAVAASPSPSSALAFAWRSPASSLLPSLSSPSSSRLFATTTTPTAAAAAAADLTLAELSPEFDAVQKATAEKMRQHIPSDRMYGVLEPFLYEYMKSAFFSTQSGNLKLSAQDAAKRFGLAVELGLRHGLPQSPAHYEFGVSHEALRDWEGVDYYQFGDDFFRPAMDLQRSVVLGLEGFQQAFAYLAKGENVVFLANHQSEADPQVLSILLREMAHLPQVEDVVYVAGHKVTTDPLAVPFSMGRNLVCIHSKKYVDADPDTKAEKQRQNLQAMSSMLHRLKSGGTMIWVAPSGGRDRRDLDSGEVPLAPFDSKTVDMFRLMALKSKRPTHFYPLAMVSYDLCPPPDATVAATGEARKIQFVPVGLACGEELAPNKVKNDKDKDDKEKDFAQDAFEKCEEAYQALSQAIAEKVAAHEEAEGRN